MYCTISLFLICVVAVSVGLSEAKNLTGKAGESITLNTGVTGLRGNYQVLWSYGVDQRVIINFDNGKLEWNESQRFQLDERTGSLTILSLHINDSGQYQGQIINGNGSQHTFILTVVEPDPTQPPPGPANTTLGVYQGLVIAAAVFVVVVVVAAVVGLTLWKTGECCFPSTCRSNRRDNGVV